MLGDKYGASQRIFDDTIDRVEDAVEELQIEPMAASCVPSIWW